MDDQHTLDSIQPNYSKRRKIYALIIAGSIFLIWFLSSILIGSVFKFDAPKHVEIKSGDSLKQVALQFKKEGIVSSATLLSTSVILMGGESNIVSGVYNFERKPGILTVARRIINGKTNIRATKITFPEGFNSAQIAERLREYFSNFDSAKFFELAKSKEGFLFPDTYFFLPNDTPETILARLEETFWQKTRDEFGWKREERDKIYDTLILASILEEEVRGLSDKRIVADIFLRRMKIGMAIQADSTLAYVTGRDSLSLTVDDLKSDSPYNSYTNRGLPPTPISNPGIESIEAALNPEPNKYLYFLTDKDGKVYYAKTFEEHKLNKQKYLK